jgi:gamma-polyglutamate biosynthesis protein CapA
MQFAHSDETTFELVAVGDISLGDAAQGVGAGVHSRFERVRTRNPRYPFEHTAPLFDGAAIVFGNLETVVSHHGLDRRSAASMEMRGHPEAAQRLRDAGFTLLNVANNHIMQHGPAAFADTVDALRRSGIAVAGEAAPSHRECVPQLLTVRGVRVAVLAFAFEPDKYWKGPVDYAFGPDCDIVRQVTLAKQANDIVICSVHWGVEFVPHPAQAEQELGRRILDAGGDLVIGHHPHVPRRVERYGRGVIAYSLGNFVFDQLWNRWLRTGLVLRVRLSKAGVVGFSTDWVWIDDDYQPRPMKDEHRRATAQAFDALQHPPAWASRNDEYEREYERLVARNRYESYRHFVRNVTRRPVTYTLQTLLRTARRKAIGA